MGAPPDGRHRPSVSSARVPPWPAFGAAASPPDRIPNAPAAAQQAEPISGTSSRKKMPWAATFMPRRHDGGTSGPLSATELEHGPWTGSCAAVVEPHAREDGARVVLPASPPLGHDL